MNLNSPKNLKAYIRLNGNSDDYSGNGNDFSWNGSEQYTESEFGSQIGNFNGSSHIFASSALIPQTIYSIDLKFTTNSLSSSQGIISQKSSVGDGRTSVYINTSGKVIYERNGVSIITSNCSLTTKS